MLFGRNPLTVRPVGRYRADRKRLQRYKTFSIWRKKFQPARSEAPPAPLRHPAGSPISFTLLSHFYRISIGNPKEMQKKCKRNAKEMGESAGRGMLCTSPRQGAAVVSRGREPTGRDGRASRSPAGATQFWLRTAPAELYPPPRHVSVGLHPRLTALVPCGDLAAGFPLP